MNDKFYILIKSSLKFARKSPVDNNPGLDNGFNIWTNTDQIHWRIYVPLGGDDLNWYPGQLDWNIQGEEIELT